MSEQGRVDLERLRNDWTLPNGRPAVWSKLYRHEAEALLAVVDAARAHLTPSIGHDHGHLRAALEPFTPAEESFRAMVDRVPMAGGVEPEWVRGYAAKLEAVSDGRVFNEVMQERERARRVAALGIELCGQAARVAELDAAGAESEALNRIDDDEPMCDLELARRVLAHTAPVAPAERVDTAVSDGLSSDTGGRSEPCARGAGGPQIPSGPAPRVDRERVRQRAERARPGEYGSGWARDCLALLAELEQAEREPCCVYARERLARVPALVEALRYYADPETYRQTGWTDDVYAVVEEDSGEKARAALAEWGQA